MKRGRIGIDWNNEPLGIEHDKVIASRLGVTPQAVYYARRVRGIPSTNPIKTRAMPLDEILRRARHLRWGWASYREMASESGLAFNQIRRAAAALDKKPKRRVWAECSELGTMPDRELMKKLGYRWSNDIGAARRALGIPPWSEVRRCACGRYFKTHIRMRRFCVAECQRTYHRLITKFGMPPEAARCALALWAFKRKLKGAKNVEVFNGTPGNYLGRSRQTAKERDRCDHGARRGSATWRSDARVGDLP